jgi:hypothetical protein
MMKDQVVPMLWKFFGLRFAVMALPVYLIAAVVWKFALGASWLYSVAGVPLGLLFGGILYCAATAAFLVRRRAGPDTGVADIKND